MIRAHRSEWRKLMRLGQLLGTWGTMVGFALLITILLFANAGSEPEPGEGGPNVPIEILETDGGWVFSFQSGGTLLGIVALVACAGSMAGEYTAGTLKVLLVREPRRTVLLAGKVTGLWTFLAAGILLALVASLATSLAMAGIRGFDTTAWSTVNAWAHVFDAWINVTAAAFVWGLMGTMLAVLFRSGPPAIGVGIAYPLLVEGLLGLALPDVVQWMPGGVLNTFTNGGPLEGGDVTYGFAAALVAAYGLVFALVAGGVLARRDVA